MEKDPATIKPELVQQLLNSVSKPEDLLGPGGLLQRLKGALMERMLEAEMSAHLTPRRRELRATAPMAG
jgi:transposase-like protein